MRNYKSEKLHVAIIMDGNGRWATQRGKPRLAGHRAGMAAVRKVVTRAAEAGVGRLTLYAFSSDNWRRPAAEVEGIFGLLCVFLRQETERLREQGVRLEVIGRRDRLPRTALREVEKAECATAAGERLHLCVAIDYSSRHAIAQAAASLPQWLNAPELLQRLLTEKLDADGGQVDLLIRTGGEKRLSDFLLWECAYAELLFTDRMWPDFNEADLDEALDEFRRRDRRFGCVTSAPSPAVPRPAPHPAATHAAPELTHPVCPPALREA